MKLFLLVFLFNEYLPVLFRHPTDQSHAISANRDPLAMKGQQSISATDKDAHVYKASINVVQV